MTVAATPLQISAPEAAWAALGSAAGFDELCNHWLVIQASLLPGAVCGAVLCEGEPAQFMPLAVWPDNTQPQSGLAEIAEQTLRARAPRQLGHGPEAVALGHPLLLGNELKGAVVFLLAPPGAEKVDAAARALLWGCGRLEAALFEDRQQRQQDLSGRALTALDLAALVAESANAKDAARQLATALATRFHCERVSVGLRRRNGRVRLFAFSHSANADARTARHEGLEAAMEEALDQGCSIAWPEIPGAAPLVTRAHDSLSRMLDGHALCTLPLSAHGELIGALCLEYLGANAGARRDRPLLEAIAALVGPLIELRRRAEAGPVARLADLTHQLLRNLFGPRFVAAKVVALSVAILAAWLAVARAEYRLTADAALEGTVRRAAVAPFDGYVRAAPKRAGDRVESGALLAELEDRELKLEAKRWRARVSQLSREIREARAAQERAALGVRHAEKREAEAELRLAEEKLARTHVRAPVGGVLVSGDLSQSLGSPVQRGDVLFEVSPLESFRVVLQIDERDIGELAVRQEGRLILNALPERELRFVVDRIIPVAQASEGRNVFKVEARPRDLPAHLLPGMEGVARLDVGERALLWIWTHRAHDWLRLTVWAWWP